MESWADHGPDPGATRGTGLAGGRLCALRPMCREDADEQPLRAAERSVGRPVARPATARACPGCRGRCTLRAAPGASPSDRLPAARRDPGLRFDRVAGVARTDVPTAGTG